MQELDRIRKLAYDKMIKSQDEKMKMIYNMLSFDNVFFEIEIDTAIDILSTLGFENPLDEYKKLIDASELQEEKVEVI